MNGYGSHTFKMVNAKGEANYVKVNFFFYVGPLKEDIFSGHLSPTFQSSLHYNYKFLFDQPKATRLYSCL